MNTRYDRRSKEAPMDFEWTNKDRNVISMDSPFNAPAKRSHADMATPNPPFPQLNPSTPTFGVNRDVPFMFHQPSPHSTPAHPWLPPSSLSSAKTPLQMPVPELNDVTMQDTSPPKVEESNASHGSRAVATGAMSRVFRARQKSREQSRGGAGRRTKTHPDEDEYGRSDEEDASENEQFGELVSTPTRRRGLQKSYSEPVTTTANHNHHYTLHMPTPRLSHSEVPYVLLGYLQFFFNLSLVFGFLYLAYQFLRAVQTDVELKMTEYSLESLQEIKACASMYADNYCADKPSPIIVHQCHEWKTCMERDASIVGRTKLLAELIGEVINSFMEPITWRTLVFTITSLSTGIFFVNTLLVFYRARHAPVNSQLAPPPTPAAAFPTYAHSAPYWAQPPTNVLRSCDPAGLSQRAWGTPLPIEGEDLVETPSRRTRRRLTEDDAVKIR